MSDQYFIDEFRAIAKRYSPAAPALIPRGINPTAIEPTDPVTLFSSPATSSSHVQSILSDPSKRKFWNDFARGLAIRHPDERKRHLQSKGIDMESGNFGATLLPQAHSQDLMDLLFTFGAFRDFVRVAPSGFSKFAQIKGLPTTVWVAPTAGQNVIPSDTTFSGAQILPQAATVAGLVQVPIGLLEDGEVDVSEVIIEAFAKAISSAIDYVAMQGNGTADITNGGMTGIFSDQSIVAAVAANGNTTVQNLERPDFLRVVASVNAAALQRVCKWWIHPSFMPLLAQIKDGESGQYVLRDPSYCPDGKWRLVGHEVVWTAQAPATNQPGKAIAAFGAPESYIVAMRRDITVEASRYAAWNTLNYQFRAYARAFAQTREASGLAILTTAAA